MARTPVPLVRSNETVPSVGEESIDRVNVQLRWINRRPSNGCWNKA